MSDENIVEFPGKVVRPDTNKLIRQVIDVIDDAAMEGEITTAELFGTIEMVKLYYHQRLVKSTDNDD